MAPDAPERPASTLSHMTTVKTSFTNLEALKGAFERCGLTLSEDITSIRGYGGATSKVQFGCRLPEGPPPAASPR